MSRIILFCFLSWICLNATAEIKKQYNDNARFQEVPWSETAVPLPPFPQQEEENWQSFYISEHYKNTASLHLQSLNVYDDYSIRYVLDIKTPTGVHNISAEGLRCNSRLHRTFAYGDTHSRKWITNTRSDWQSLDAGDEVRLQLRFIFCDDGTPRNHDDAVTRLIKLGTKTYHPQTQGNSSSSW